MDSWEQLLGWEASVSPKADHFWSRTRMKAYTARECVYSEKEGANGVERSQGGINFGTVLRAE